MPYFHTAVLFDISCTADKEIRYRKGGQKEMVGVLKLQKDTYTGEITGEFSRGK